MTSPLISIGGAALGGLAIHALKSVQSGGFLRELVSKKDNEPVTSKESESVPPPQFDLSSELPRFLQQLHQRLKAEGIDLSQPLVLKDDGRGGVIVDGDHPYRAEVEELVNNDVQLTSSFQAIVAAATRERDEMSSWLGDSLGEFRLEIGDRGDAIRFE
jgi:hypothetical protein